MHMLHTPYGCLALASTSSEPSSYPWCFPSSHSPGSLWEPLPKRNHAACQRQQQLLRHLAGPWTQGMCAPHVWQQLV